MKRQIYQLAEVKCNNLSLLGYSAAGEETVVIVPELDVVFDIGKCQREALSINHLLLTHGHFDHAAGLPYYFAQRSLQNIANGVALMPQEIVAPFESLLECWGKIDGKVPPHQLIGMQHDDLFRLNRNLYVRAFTTNHIVPSLGYSIIETRHKLKPEFRDMNEQQLIELKTQGIVITVNEESPLIAYLGDTALFDCGSLPHVANAQILIIECTFFHPDHASRSNSYKHLHISDLTKLLPTMNNKHVVITHVTKSINLNEAKSILHKHLNPEILPRVSFLMG